MTVDLSTPPATPIAWTNAEPGTKPEPHQIVTCRLWFEAQQILGGNVRKLEEHMGELTK